jgi:rRNA maturation RNase YbeY
MPTICFHDEGLEEPSLLESETFTKEWIFKIIALESVHPGDINFIFCQDDYLLKINQQYLTHDFYTDIITFDYCEGNLISGDIFISVDRVRENAQNMNVSFDQELHRVMAHGILHLIGYKDGTDTDKELMRAKEDSCLSLLKS